MRRYLIVGNQTLGSDALREAVHRRADAEPSQFRVVVPPTHPMGAWTEGEARVAADANLRAALEHFRAEGVDISGNIGDHNPVAAVGDVLIEDPGFDEIIVSTLPPKTSAWLGKDLPHRLARAHPHIAIVHVTAEQIPAG